MACAASSPVEYSTMLQSEFGAGEEAPGAVSAAAGVYPRHRRTWGKRGGQGAQKSRGSRTHPQPCDGTKEDSARAGKEALDLWLSCAGGGGGRGGRRGAPGRARGLGWAGWAGATTHLAPAVAEAVDLDVDDGAGAGHDAAQVILGRGPGEVVHVHASACGGGRRAGTRGGGGSGAGGQRGIVRAGVLGGVAVGKCRRGGLMRTSGGSVACPRPAKSHCIL
jgi:hypothetical protein